MAGRGRMLKSLLRKKPEEDDDEDPVDKNPVDKGNPNESSSPQRISEEYSGISSGSGRGLLMQSVWNRISNSTTSSSSSLSKISPSICSFFSDQENVPAKNPGNQFGDATEETEESESVSIHLDPITRKPLDICLNYVRVNRESGYGIFQYRITILPVVRSNRTIIQMFESDPLKSLIGNNPALIFGDNLFVPVKIESFDLDQVSVPILEGSKDQLFEKEEPKICSVSVRFVQKVPLKEQKFFFNVLFRQVMYDLNFHCMRNKFFDPDVAIELEEYMLEIWPGCVIEVGDIEKDSFMLTCDASHRLLQMSNVLKKMELLMVHQNSQQLIRKQLVGTSVLTRYNSRTYRVDEVDFDTNPNSTFRCGNKVITYVEYFKKHWGIDIKNKEQPMLIHRKSIPDLHMVSIIYLVPELCNLTGLNSIRSDHAAYSAIQRSIQLEPGVRYNKFLKFLELVHSNSKVCARLGSWGIKLDRSSFSAEAFVLNEEEIVFGDCTAGIQREEDIHEESESDIQNRLKVDFFESCGNSRNNNRRSIQQSMLFWNRANTKSMLKPVNFEQWMVVACHKDKALVDSFVQSCRRFSRKISISLESPRIVWLNSARDDSYLMAIKQNFEIDDQLIVVITPDAVHIKSRYDAVKQLCCVQLAVPSQFIRAFTLRNSRKMDLLLPSLFVQMTCKMGGYPWALQMPLIDAMFVGIDIYHNRKIRNQSVIGFVASLNTNATQWFSKGFIKRTNTTDLVDDEDGQLVVDAMIEALRRYQRLNNKLPSTILIYRDDVGVPVTVLCSIEYSLLERAIKAVYTGSSPLKSSTECANPSDVPTAGTEPDPSMPHIVFMAVAKRLSTKLYLPIDNSATSETSKAIPTELSSSNSSDSNTSSEEEEEEDDDDSNEDIRDNEVEDRKNDEEVKTEVPSIDVNDIDDTKFDIDSIEVEDSDSDSNSVDEEEEEASNNSPLDSNSIKLVENVPTGTVFVYDRKKYQQFFLVSQRHYRSCALPVRIRILKNSDSNQLSSEQLQIISFKLCHLYYNCFYSIREPAPIRYAHKIAFFIGENLKCNPATELDDRLYYL